MLATSNKALVLGHNHLLTTGTDDPTLYRPSAERERERERKKESEKRWGYGLRRLWNEGNDIWSEHLMKDEN